MSVVSVARDLLLSFAIKRTGGIDLSKLDKIPDSLAWPLQRDGLAPTQRLEEARESDPVQRLTSFMGLEVWLVTGYDEAREVLGNPNHSTDNMVMLVAGRAGGLKAGQHIVAKDKHPAHVFNTALQALGISKNLGEISGTVPLI